MIAGFLTVSSARAEDLTSYAPLREATASLGNQGPVGVGQELELAFKRYAAPGAQPVLLLPGIASNDRVWDAAVPEYSFARRLRQAGYDVWIANYRHSGTSGFRSASPALPFHWTVEDEAIYDLPAMISKVRASTGQRPFVLGHSLSAWILEGYLAGLSYEDSGKLVADRALGLKRQAELKGVVTIAGVYNAWWSKSVLKAFVDPVLSKADYYRSNYELEALAHTPFVYDVTAKAPSLPLSWVGDMLDLPLDHVPGVGPALAAWYRRFQTGVISTPLLSMFYFPDNVSPEVVRTHGLDGLEELGPRLLEQLGHAVVERETTAYYHGAKPARVYRYAGVRDDVRVPMLFVAGTRDRLANADMIRRDGYERTQSPDKAFWTAEAGHLDLLNGRASGREVVRPVIAWMRARQ